jgi:hypothetical protein
VAYTYDSRYGGGAVRLSEVDGERTRAECRELETVERGSIIKGL